MSDPKILNLVSITVAEPDNTAAYAIMQRAAGHLQEEGFDHHFGYASHEEGPEPSVWLDKETGAVVQRVPAESAGYYGSTIALGLLFEPNMTTDGTPVPVMKSYQDISEEWEVLA